MGPVETLRAKYEALQPLLTERMRRLWAATEARALGHGGIAAVATATELARSTIVKGLQELEAGSATRLEEERQRSRRPGGGRKRLAEVDKELVADLEAMVEPSTRGDPQSPLRWTCKSTRQLSVALRGKGHAVSPQSVATLLAAQGYSLQAPRKTKEGSNHPERDAQFRYLQARVEEMQAQGQPVISVDCKKKELIGDYKNAGREWQPTGSPELVRVYDFVDRTLGKAIPYGVYDVTRNEGWVQVGVDHDTAAFAVESIRRWWRAMGSRCYRTATDLLITADGGGSNGARNRAWKLELQQLADETCLALHVCHLPPGTSKWNKIEHRLFSNITQNWRGRPLVSHEVVVNLIGATRTRSGLRVRARLDRRAYRTGRKVSDDELSSINLERDSFHGEWNYIIRPHE